MKKLQQDLHQNFYSGLKFDGSTRTAYKECSYANQLALDASKKAQAPWSKEYTDEIYLTDTRSNGQKYYHFLFIALDSCGFKMLTELSSSAWLNGYYDRGLYRVPTLKTEVEAIINKYGQGHIYASTACIGGYIGQQILTLKEAEIIGNIKGRKEAHDNIVNFILWCINTFGENNFALEVQPGISEEQLIVNNFMPTLAKVFNLPVCLTSDAHFLKESDRAIHKAFLNSKEAEREVDSFYQSCWLHTQEENLRAIASTNLDYEQMCKNSIDIMNRIEDYSLLRNQEVPTAIVPYFPKEEEANHKFISYPTLDKLSHSDNEQERAWVNLCYDKLKEKNLANDTYMSRLEEEADTQAEIGKKLNTCIFAYPLFMRHYINLIWDCGSTVGCGRGSAGGGLSHWLLGITQTDPIKTKSYFWRFLNKSRQELPDLDIDICPSKREEILNKTREETGKLGCVHVCTYGALSTKAAIKAACFDEKTLVLTAEGEKKIIDIIPRKDKVLTTNGWETVQEKTYLDNKEVIAVKTKNSTNPYVFCTPEHEFLVIDTKADGKRNVGQTDTELAKQIFPEINIYNSQDNVFQRYQRNIVHCSPKWIQAKDIKQGTRKGVRGLTKIDRTIEQTQKITWKNDFAGKHGRGISSSISITEDFCELIGIFLAEGNISYNFTGINFTIHQKETNFKERILELMWNVFQLDNYGISTKKDNKALIIRYSSRQLGAFFKQLFNCQTPQDCTQWNKRVPQMLRKIHPYLQLQIIKGYFLGDGYASLKRTPIAKLTTVSKKMADDFINIYHRNFVQPSVDVEDYSYRPSITYDIVVYSEKAKNLYHFMLCVKEISKIRR